MYCLSSSSWLLTLGMKLGSLSLSPLTRWARKCLNLNICHLIECAKSVWLEPHRNIGHKSLQRAVTWSAQRNVKTGDLWGDYSPKKDTTNWLCQAGKQRTQHSHSKIWMWKQNRTYANSLMNFSNANPRKKILVERNKIFLIHFCFSLEESRNFSLSFLFFFLLTFIEIYFYFLIASFISLSLLLILHFCTLKVLLFFTSTSHTLHY